MCVSDVMHYKNIVILNQKVPVVKIIPLTEAAEGRGAMCHGDPPTHPRWTKSRIF